MKTKFLPIVSLVLVFALLLVTPASALFIPTNGQAASLVLGQPDFVSNTGQTTQSGISDPFDVAVDPTTGKVFVADSYNSRVLRFANVSALIDGAAAEAELGQPDFTSNAVPYPPRQNSFSTTRGLAVDASGRLWVVDWFNNRVLRFDNAAAKANGANADGVLGQPDFTSRECQVTQSGMCGPNYVSVDSSGRLWVSDAGPARVLRFDNAAAKANGANADGVLGQPDFTSYYSGFGPNISRSAMRDPSGLAVDASGRLYVADQYNHRVLRFDNAAAKANGANADGVLGQPDFTSNPFQTTQNGMAFPTGVTVDTSGRLYVADQSNNRILVFDTAASLPNGANASYVLGQVDFTTGTANTGGISDATLYYPMGVFFDPAAKILWVADSYNNRILMYGQPYATLHIMPFIGLVRLFLPPGVTPIGSISIQTRDGSIHTFGVTRNTRILPASRANQLGVGSSVTLLARFDPSTGHFIALQIVLHPEGAGPGFPTFTPAATSIPTETPTPTATPAGVPTSVPTETPTETATPAGVPGSAP